MAPPAGQPFSTVEYTVENYQGDLLRYLPTSDGIGPRREEPLVRYQTAADTGELDADALLGDVMPPVALVGTSHTPWMSGIFPGFLKQAMGQDVPVYALEAQGLCGDARIFERPAARDPRVTHVLWELPERALIQSMDVIVEGKDHVSGY